MTQTILSSPLAVMLGIGEPREPGASVDLLTVGVSPTTVARYMLGAALWSARVFVVSLLALSAHVFASFSVRKPSEVGATPRVIHAAGTAVCQS